MSGTLIWVIASLSMTTADSVGTPTVINGHALKVAGRTFRLFGITAPDLAQTCIVRGKSYKCGAISKTALMDLVAGAEVRCAPRPGTAPKRQNGATIAVCHAGGYDLSEGMTYTGWALAMPRTGTKYLQFEKDAQNKRRGLWKGAFTRPWNWRPPAK